mgnify:CR=1 FL=1
MNRQSELKLGHAGSKELYGLVREGTPAEQAAAFRALWEYLYPIAAYMTRNEPGGDALAQDCAQKGLERIYRRLDQCREPDAFRTWCRRIVSHIVIDELRRRKRLTILPDPELLRDAQADNRPRRPVERIPLGRRLENLREILEHAPISRRSSRVVIGRYLDEEADEALAEIESELAGREVRPSHIQVTRSKNMAKLRDWQPLLDYLES